MCDDVRVRETTADVWIICAWQKRANALTLTDGIFFFFILDGVSIEDVSQGFIEINM